MWERLRAEVAIMRTERGTPVHEFAARFVGVTEFAGNGDRPGENVVRFDLTTFAQLIPTEEWRIDDLPAHAPEDFDAPHGTLDHRRVVAVTKLREVLRQTQRPAGT